VRELGDQRALASFEAPVAAVVKGQFCVFYRGDRVLGGALIAGAQKEDTEC
jgi:tRNA U34 2-thiouridine synthase MnmA/TrmU